MNTSATASVQRYPGIPTIREIRPLHGVFGEDGEYEISVNLEKIHQTVASITKWNMETREPVKEYTCPVKWKLPILNRAKLKKFLRDSPEKTFQIEVKIKAHLPTKVNIRSNNSNLLDESEVIIHIFNEEDKSNNDDWLAKFSTWVYQAGVGSDRIHFLKYLIKRAPKSRDLKTAGDNAQALLNRVSNTTLESKATDYPSKINEEMVKLTQKYCKVHDKQMKGEEITVEELDQLDEAIKTFRELILFSDSDSWRSCLRYCTEKMVLAKGFREDPQSSI